MNATKLISIPLHFWTCYFLNSEDGNYSTIKPNLIFNCQSQGRFLAGSDPNGEYYGHTLCILLMCLIYMVGIFGFVTNVINVVVLRRTLQGSSLRNLLVILAVFELAACIFSITFSTAMVVILENYSRGETAFRVFKITHVLFSLGRTIAIYITILIAIERYLVVAFPIQSKSWLSPAKSQCYLVAVILFSVLLNLPWIFNTTVDQNDVKLSPNTSLAEFPYILKGTSFAKNVYPKIMCPQLMLNYVAPFPLLLIFNGLLYLSIHNWNKSRQHVSRKQKTEINAAKMFSVVVLILLLCHSVSCVIVFMSQFQGTVYRELMLLQVFSVTLSAAINFLVYFGFGKAFRVEFRQILVFGKSLKNISPQQETTGGQTQSSKDSASRESSGVSCNGGNKALEMQNR